MKASFTSHLFSGAAKFLSHRRHGGSSSFLVLTYHRVLPAPDPLLPEEPDVRRFARQLDWLKDCFHVLTVRDAVRLRSRGSLPAGSLCITFDDGYSNNTEIAIPELARRGLAATFYIACGYTRGTNMFNDRVIEAVRRAPQGFNLAELGLEPFIVSDAPSRIAAIRRLLPAFKYLPLPERERSVAQLWERVGMATLPPLMMNEAQVRSIASAGMEVGAHTVSHPILARVPEDEAQEEIGRSKHQLQDMIGQPVVSFAYPNGRPGTDYGRTHVEMVRAAGFESAVSTAWGSVSADSDVFQLPRVAPWDRSAGRYLMRLMRCYLQAPAATV